MPISHRMVWAVIATDARHVGEIDSEDSIHGNGALVQEQGRALQRAGGVFSDDTWAVSAWVGRSVETGVAW